MFSMKVSLARAESSNLGRATILMVYARYVLYPLGKHNLMGLSLRSHVAYLRARLYIVFQHRIEFFLDQIKIIGKT